MCVVQDVPLKEIRMVALHSKHPPVTPLDPTAALFNSRRVRRAVVGDDHWYSLIDLLNRLDAGDERPSQLLAQAGLPPRSAFFAVDTPPEPAVTREEALRIVALLGSHAARRMQAWMADRAMEAQRLEQRHGSEDAVRDASAARSADRS